MNVPASPAPASARNRSALQKPSAARANPKLAAAVASDAAMYTRRGAMRSVMLVSTGTAPR
jgi:hypothetical protein